jgi:hypothetical protein
MSLHALANHLQQAGRGDDKVLIHMTPREVKGLQSLAMAQGGSLTINPETGLPEAGFLDRMLPTIIGAGLTIASGGALSPLMAAGITGAGYGIAKGSLQEGLMAGLGAYGGAGLASGLSAAGAAGTAGANTAANATNIVPNAQGAAAANNFSSSYSGANVIKEGANAGSLGGAQTLNLSQPLAKPFASGFQNAGDVMRGGLVNTPQATQVALSKPVAQSVFQNGTGLPAELVKNTTSAAGTVNTAPTYFDNVKGGFKEATGSWDGLKNVWDKTPTGTGYGLLATGMGIMQDRRNKGPGAPAASDAYIRPYDYSIEQDPNAYAPSASTAERRYFVEPRFTARPIEKVAKEGGLMSVNSYGIGGEVEQMSAMNSVSGNTMYPQSQLQTAMYSNPMVQRPVQNDVITAGLDTPTQPYSGEARMASGGVANPTGGGAVGNGAFGMGLIAQLLRQGAFNSPTPAPASQAPTESSMPSVQTAGAPDTSMVPNTQIQSIRTPEQQLGLGSFYDSMNQRLAEQGGYSGYAAGGVARYNVGGSLTPWATGSSYNPGVPIASGQLYLGNPPPMASAPAKTAPSEPVKPYVSPAALDPYIPKGQGAYDPDTSMVPNIQLPTLYTPEQQLGLGDFYDSMNRQLAQRGGYGSYAAGGMAEGGESHLGDYSDGGRLLKGPGDGVSDSIPASIGNRQPARLADGEFVVPARIVSELGNGSTEAGARKLYQMMERVQNARRKTVGKNQVAKNNKAEKLMPA